MTEQLLLDTMRKSLRLPNLDVNDRMGTVRGWDSLRHVRLMLQLEREFKVKIPVDQFGALTSVEAILAFFRPGRELAA